jgi:uncharacterized caspase-like protein
MLCGVITACADTKVALVIGNSKYPAPLDLANPVNDARDLADSLKKMGFEVDLRLDLDKSHFDQALGILRDQRTATARHAAASL